MYIVPEDLKEELRGIIGKLLKSEKDLIDELKNKKLIISVGDMITYTLLINDIKPDIAVVDFRHRRREITEEMKKVIRNYGEEVTEVKNPPSTISDELIEALEYAYRKSKDGNILLMVKGEEDLASLMAILLAPEGATVIYGLPDKGVVLVDVTDKEKEIVRKTLKRCIGYGTRDN